MHRRARLLVLTSAVLAASTAVGTWSARAQIPLPGDGIPTTTTTPTSTTSTTQNPTPTTPTTGPSAPPTSAPPPQDGTAPPPGTSVPPSTAPPLAPPALDPNAPVDGGGDDAAAPNAVLPPQYQALMNAVRRSPANNTRKLLDALGPLQEFGLTPTDAIALAFGRFPVAGVATFSDDWWYPRSAAPFHMHQGTDIFADMGTPVRSPADGVLTRSNGGLGGLSAKVVQADGTYFYMAHLSAVPPEQVDGQSVKVGDVIGFVGNSGDAAGGPSHLHFEVHMAPANNPYLVPPPPPPPAPKPAAKKGAKAARVTTTTTTAPKPTRTGKGAAAKAKAPPKPQPFILGDIHDPVLYGRGTVPATDPKPFLDQWLNEALANVPALIAKLEAGRPRAILATGMLRRFTDGGGLFAAPAAPPRTQLLWASSASPSGGPLQLAEAEASAAASEVDWSALARREQARAAAAAESSRWAAALLDPLTPPSLRPLFNFSTAAGAVEKSRPGG
ncbi:MAG: peptidoglycan LD-endopeptidase LytH [Acidimicrobiaceae bacterium]|nr:peptidoglycan LD-endopeptidase LytH [Acidimicrobiaceae bacterium]